MLQIGLGDPLTREALRMTSRVELIGNDQIKLELETWELDLIQRVLRNGSSHRASLKKYLTLIKRREYVQLRVLASVLGVSVYDMFRIVLGQPDFEEGIDAIGTTDTVRFLVDLTLNELEFYKKKQEQKKARKSSKIIIKVPYGAVKSFEDGFEKGLEKGFDIGDAQRLGDCYTRNWLSYAKEDDIRIFIPRSQKGNLLGIFSHRGLRLDY